LLKTKSLDNIPAAAQIKLDAVEGKSPTHVVVFSKLDVLRFFQNIGNEWPVASHFFSQRNGGKKPRVPSDAIVYLAGFDDPEARATRARHTAQSPT